jgi:hypothetical protein
VYGSVERYVSFVASDLFIQSVVDRATQRAKGDSRFAAIDADWSKCMKNAGYSFAHPSDPLALTWPPPRPGPKETSTAVADMRCRDELHYLSRIAVLEREYQRLESSPIASSLQEIQRERERVVAELPSS